MASDAARWCVDVFLYRNLDSGVVGVLELAWAGKYTSVHFLTSRASGVRVSGWHGYWNSYAELDVSGYDFKDGDTRTVHFDPSEYPAEEPSLAWTKWRSLVFGLKYDLFEGIEVAEGESITASSARIRLTPFTHFGIGVVYGSDEYKRLLAPFLGKGVASEKERYVARASGSELGAFVMNAVRRFLRVGIRPRARL